MTCGLMPSVPLWNGERADCSLHAFDVGSFSPAAFAAQRIACPPAIARSSPVRQATFFHGRVAARRALARFRHGDTEVAVGPVREPRWPAGIVGSISHTASHAAAIALRAREHGGIGIDIERIADGAGCDAVAAMCVQGEELAQLRAMAAGMPLQLLLTVLFSAKESFYKAAFPTVGTFFDFHAVRVSAIDLIGACVHLRVAQALSPALPVGSVCVAHFRLGIPDTVFTLCSLAPGCHDSVNRGELDDRRIHPL